MKIIGKAIIVDVPPDGGELLLMQNHEPLLVRLASDDSQMFIPDKPLCDSLLQLGWAKVATEDWLRGTSQLREEMPRLRILFSEIRRRENDKET